MIIECGDGRLSAGGVAALIMLVGLRTEAEMLRDAGYVLQPVAAPRAVGESFIRYRLTWRRRAGAVTWLVRHTVTVRAPRDG